MTNERPEGRQCSHCCAYFDDKTPEGAAHLASCKRYNGWTNYETWAVALWLDNDEGAYNYWGNATRRAMQEAENEVDDLDEDAPEEKHVERLAEVRRIAVRAIAGQLKDEHEELARAILKKGGGEHSVFSDLSSAQLNDVDWEEIAESRIE